MSKSAPPACCAEAPGSDRAATVTKVAMALASARTEGLRMRLNLVFVGLKRRARSALRFGQYTQWSAHPVAQRVRIERRYGRPTSRRTRPRQQAVRRDGGRRRPIDGH